MDPQVAVGVEAAQIPGPVEAVDEGVRVVAVSPWTLYRRPQAFVHRLLKVVALGLASPPPDIRVVQLDGTPITW